MDEVLETIRACRGLARYEHTNLSVAEDAACLLEVAIEARFRSDRHITELEAEIKRLRAMQSWQPLETCPKDTEVLAGVWVKSRFSGSPYFQFEIIYWSSDNEFVDVLASGLEPTHWIPLPDAPKNPKDVQS